MRSILDERLIIALDVDEGSMALALSLGLDQKQWLMTRNGWLHPERLSARGQALSWLADRLSMLSLR